MSSDTFSRHGVRGGVSDIHEEYDDHAGSRSESRQAMPYQTEGQSEPMRRSGAAAGPRPRHSGRFEESYDDDAERLYESFSDLYEDFDEGRSKTPFVIIGALLAVAIVGGGLAFAYKRGMSDGADEPVVIRADRTPAKVEPVDPGGVAIPHQDRRIYDQVTGQDTPEAETALAESDPAVAEIVIPEVEDGPAEVTAGVEADAPGADVQTADEPPMTIGALASRVAAGDLDRVASDPAPVPGPEAAPAPEPTAAERAAQVSAAQQTDQSVGLQPRQVRTVSIGPDGRVIAAEPDAAAAQPPAAATRDLSRPDSGPSASAPTVPQIAQPFPSVGAEPPARDQGLGLTAGTLGANDSAPGPGVEEESIQTTLLTPSPRPKPRPTTAGRAPSQSTAALRPEAPISAPAVSSPGPALQGFAVQVASHRRQAEAVAKFADLQRRYPNLISGYQPLIQRADLGEKGIFYRLRIGPIASRGEANRLCESLRQAGLAGCFVRSL